MWYSIHTLAMICGTTPAVILEAATVMGKKPMAGMLCYPRKTIPTEFFVEVDRIRAMHERQAQRRAKS